LLVKLDFLPTELRKKDSVTDFNNGWDEFSIAIMDSRSSFEDYTIVGSIRFANNDA
jgi:hypothetical protein